MEKKGPDSASKRPDSEPKRNKLLHELVAVVLSLCSPPFLHLSPSLSLHSFSEDGCHPAVSRRVCGPPSRHKDSYLTRCPSCLSSGAPSNGTPKPGARRDPDNTCSPGRRRAAAAAAAARTKLRHSLTRCLLVDLSPFSLFLPSPRIPSRLHPYSPSVLHLVLAQASLGAACGVGTEQAGQPERRDGERGSGDTSGKLTARGSEEQGQSPRQTGSHEERYYTRARAHSRRLSLLRVRASSDVEESEKERMRGGTRGKRGRERERNAER